MSFGEQKERQETHANVLYKSRVIVSIKQKHFYNVTELSGRIKAGQIGTKIVQIIF